MISPFLGGQLREWREAMKRGNAERRERNETHPPSLIAPFFVIALFVVWGGLFLSRSLGTIYVCIRGVLKIFIERKLSNLCNEMTF